MLSHFHQDIPGWFDYPDVYRLAVSNARPGDALVEVGVWKGQSLAFLGVEAANSGKPLRVVGVDHFRGSPESSHFNDPDLGRLEEVARANLAPLGDRVEIMAADSVWAADEFPAESCGFVFIDGEHTAPAVIRDIDAWHDKVRPGGILAGHDIDWPGVQAAIQAKFHTYTVMGRCWLVGRR